MTQSARVAAALLIATSASAQAHEFADSGPQTPFRSVQACVVQRIVDGDTISCKDLGSVRLIGIDSPERTQKPFGPAAAAALASMLQVGDTIQLERDVALRDRSRRLLAYAWREGRMLNWLMLRGGWAVVLTITPNVQFVDAFVIAQRRARAERRGLWAVDGFECLPAERRRRVC
ncbi:MAG TPA: thermonuclease family protein [Gemmatimonadaceae bacterium]|nr:thermonuclease family protein [Gemmatimonadaceae bacterium]